MYGLYLKLFVSLFAETINIKSGGEHACSQEGEIPVARIAHVMQTTDRNEDVGDAEGKDEQSSDNKPEADHSIRQTNDGPATHGNSKAQDKQADLIDPEIPAARAAVSGEPEFILEVVDDGHVVSFDPVFEERQYVSNRNMIGGRIRRSKNRKFVVFGKRRDRSRHPTVICAQTGRKCAEPGCKVKQRKKPFSAL